jgi:hypothetical protein
MKRLRITAKPDNDTQYFGSDSNLPIQKSEKVNSESNCSFPNIKDDDVKKLRGFSPPANYIDRAIAACRRSANFS